MISPDMQRARAHRQQGLQRPIYVPPGADEIERFSQKACDAFLKQGRSEYEAKQVRWAISGFFKVVAELTAKRLNATTTGYIKQKGAL